MITRFSDIISVRSDKVNSKCHKSVKFNELETPTPLDRTIEDMSTRIRRETFGDRIRRLRKDRGMTQHDVVDALLEEQGVSVGRSYISELERSDKVPGGEVTAGLARLFNTTTDYLLDGGVDTEVEHGQRYTSPEADEIANIVDDLPPARRREALNLVKVIWAQACEDAAKRDHWVRSMQSDDEGLGEAVAGMADVIGWESAEALTAMFRATFAASRRESGVNKKRRNQLDEAN